MRRTILILAIELVTVANLSSQTSDGTDLGRIFGKPSRNPCVVGQNAGFTKFCNYYRFNSDFSIGVERNNNFQILRVYLMPKGPLEELEDTIQEKERSEFLRMVNKARPLGRLKFSGEVIPLPDPSEAPRALWEVYERGIVISTSDAFDQPNPKHSRITVLFPINVAGTVLSVEPFEIGEHSMPLVFVDGCSYLTFQKDVQRVRYENLAVIGPRNSCTLQ